MKGSIMDMVFVCVIIGAFGLTSMIIYLLLSNIGADPNIAAIPEVQQPFAMGMQAIVILGNSALFITIIFGLVAVISAFYTESHPIFLIFSLIMFSICIMLISIFSGIFVDLANTAQLAPVASQFYDFLTLMVNFPIFAVMLGTLVIIALYIKRNDLGQIGGGMG
jgi:hypothetical protein